MAPADPKAHEAFHITQNDDTRITLLQSRRQIQRESSRILLLQVFLVVIIPSALAIISFYISETKPYSAFIALTIAAIDIVLLDRMQKRRLTLSAKIQEEFDCAVFDLEWNAFVAGKRVEPRIISIKADKYEKDEGREREVGWYAEILSGLTFAQARLAAQILNIQYDKVVRSNYQYMLLIIICMFVGLLGFAVAHNDFNFSAIVLSVLAPIFPSINWCSREVFRQYDAITKLVNVEYEAIKIWGALVRGEISEDRSAALSRQIQTANYIRRSNSPMIFEKLYWIRRARLENRMIKSAQAMIEECHSSAVKNS